MKRFFSTILILLFMGVGLSQAQPKQPYTLLGESFNKELKFETSPVSETSIKVLIYPENATKNLGYEPVHDFQITRGKKTHKMDISDLPAGNYIFTVYITGKGSVYSKKFSKS
ncbi:MAG: hypothetical protein Q4F57_05035 [Weeksellaceae bacterium]|nr:hypothetical protein [Weeksellaceae bacterium]